MPTRTLFTLALAVLAVVAVVAAVSSPPLAAQDAPFDLDERISLELAGAAAVDVFNSFASITRAEAVLDPELDGKVTIQLANVSARTTITAVCEMLDCEWQLVEGPPRQLIVKSRGGAAREEVKPAGDLDTNLNLSLRDAPVEEVLKSFARIGQWELLLEKVTVSVELENTPLHQALDEVCAQAGCVWSLDQVGEDGVLRVDWID